MHVTHTLHGIFLVLHVICEILFGPWRFKYDELCTTNVYMFVIIKHNRVMFRGVAVGVVVQIETKCVIYRIWQVHTAEATHSPL